MGKMLVVLLGLGVMMFTAYYYIRGQGAGVANQEVSAPKRTLDNVRGAADRIEDDAQRRADELLDKTAP